MNRPVLLIFLLFYSLTSYEQVNYLFIKKGYHKKRTYTEGSRIHLQLHGGEEKKGIITLLRNDTIYINGYPIPRLQVSAVILHEKKKKPFPADLKTMLIIGGGAALTAIGLSLNNANKPADALVAGATIGYGPLLIKHFGSRLLYALHRKKFKTGKKFRLHVFDLYILRQRAF